MVSRFYSQPFYSDENAEGVFSTLDSPPKYVENYGFCPLQKLVQDMLFGLQASGRSRRTHEYYERPLRVFLDYCRKKHLPEDANLITTDHVRGFLSWVGKRTGPILCGKNSIRHFSPSLTVPWIYYKALRRLFNWGIEERRVNYNPVTIIRFKRPQSAPILAYSAEEIRALRDACDDEIRNGDRLRGLRGKALLLLFLDSGLRLSEMSALRISDVNLDEGTVAVLGKGNKRDVCPFSKTTAEFLTMYLTERHSRSVKTDKLWITEYGHQLSIEGIDEWFRCLKRQAGITSHGGVHRLRHSSAILYLRVAHDSFLLQLFLRHTDLYMTRRYTQSLKKEEAIAAHRAGASPVESLGLK